MASFIVENISQKRAGRHILHDVSFKAEYNTIVAFLGPNGAGKTTMIKTVMGLYSLQTTTQTPTIRLGEHDLVPLSVAERVQAGLVYVPQQTSLFRDMSVKNNLELVFSYHPYWKSRPRKTFIDQMHQLLALTNLQHTEHQKARLLSGGQQRKVEVVRALLMHPQVVMFDEPFAGVDPKSMYELKKLFVHIKDNGMAVILSDHHVDQLLSIAQHIYVMINGRIITSGTIQEIMKNNDLKEHYLGSQFYAEVVDRFLS